MSPIPAATQAVLVYDRISQNRRKSAILVALAILLIVPFVGAVSFTVAELTTAQFGSRATTSRANQESLRKSLSRRLEAGDLSAEERRELDLQFAIQSQKIREETQNEYAAVAGFRTQMMVVVAGGLTALLALLFWSVASSPTSKILTMCGARPAGAAEEEARRLLENLAIGAGLPTPKLYLIDSPKPNAFAAGSDPSRSVVAVTQGLLLLLNRRELEGVLAHELSHIGNHDTRLNTLVTALALFLRLPYLLLKRRFQNYTNYHESTSYRKARWYRFAFTLASIPALLYIFVIAPVLAALIRSAISRNREFLADADAALLTRNPEGLLCALAKIGACGSVVAASNPVISHLYFSDPATPGLSRSLFHSSPWATHPPIEKRIARLMEFHADVPASAVATAVREGTEFSRNHKPIAETTAPESIKHDEISVLTAGNPMGRVFRILSASPIYDQPNPTSDVLARMPAGALLVVFDDPGKFRQVLTPDHTFGYLPGSVKMQRVDMLPSEVPRAAAREAAGPAPEYLGPDTPQPESATEVATVTVRLIDPVTPRGVDKPRAPRQAVQVPALPRPSGSGLSGKQLAIAATFGLVVFASVFLAMMQFGGK